MLFHSFRHSVLSHSAEGLVAEWLILLYYSAVVSQLGNELSYLQDIHTTFCEGCVEALKR